MNGQADLERRYRRLLAWYPPEHRRDHGDEMLGVLLAAARPGQRRPGLAEAANLLWGGLRIRIRASLRDHSDPRWRDALAVTSVAAPLFLVGLQLLQLGRVWADMGGAVSTFHALQGMGVQVALPFLVAGLTLFRLRRTAIVVTLAFVVYVGVVRTAGLAGPFAAFYLLFGVLETAALAASAGPRRGLEILTWPRGVMIVLGGAVAGLIGWSESFSHRGSLAALVLALATAAVLALLFPIARRVLILLAIPVYPAALAYVPAYFLFLWTTTPGDVLLLYLPPLLLLSLALFAVLRSGRRAPGRGSQDVRA